jgi:hypothetical protein
MSLLQNSNAISAGGYDINNSLRFRASASAYLNRTPASVSNRKTWTWSGWVKKSNSAISNFISADPNSGNRATSFYTRSITDGRLEFEYFDGTTTYNLSCAALLRDPSSWYHLVLLVDTTQATNTNRTKIYINGVLQTVSGTYVPQNTDMDINNTSRHNLGRFQNASAGAGNYLDGYLAEVNFIDGQALTPSSFGKTDSLTGQWIPKRYGGAYGTNGFYLKFSDASAATAAAIGKDFSPNGNNWTPNNISITSGITYDAMIDSPTLSAVASNFAVLNPLDIGTSTPTVSNANLRVVTPSTGGGLIRGTIGVSSGKWYWEATLTSQAQYAQTGITSVQYTASAYSYLEQVPGAMYFIHGNKGTGPTGTNVAYGSTVADGDVVGVALDMDAGTLTFYKNGVSMGTAFTSISGTYLPSFGDSANSISSTFDVNFGQRPFAYTIPSGFKSLNTYNLP